MLYHANVNSKEKYIKEIKIDNSNNTNNTTNNNKQRANNRTQLNTKQFLCIWPCVLNEIKQEQRKLSRTAIFAHLYGLIAAIAAPLTHLLGME